MPHRAPRVCPRCQQLIHAERCATCWPAYAGTRRHADISSRKWDRIKKRRLKAEPFCRQCGRLATEVDHIINIGSGGPLYEYDNTQSLCADCHHSKSAHEATAARHTPRKYE